MCGASIGSLMGCTSGVRGSVDLLSAFLGLEFPGPKMGSLTRKKIPQESREIPEHPIENATKSGKIED